VAQVGVFCLLFPLLAAPPEAGVAFTTAAWTGGAIHAASHGLAKAALFLAAGVVILATGGDALEDTRALARRLPLTTAALLLAGVALVGTPLSGTYAGKKLLLDAAGAAGHGWWRLPLHGATVLTAAYVLAMLRFVLRREPGPPRVFHSVPRWVQAVPVVLAVIALTLAWPDGVLAELLAIGASPDSAAAALPQLVGSPDSVFAQLPEPPQLTWDAAPAAPASLP
jgi:multicomponent Na+:H+ antiporter subunit D